MMSAHYDEFRSLVENGREEAPLQKFLEANPNILVSSFDKGSFYPTVFPHFSLAGEYVPDFVMIGHRSVWLWEVHLIEIEPALLPKPIFTQAGHSSGRLLGAERQISDWREWMEKNRNAYFVDKALKCLRERGAWDAQPSYYNLSDGTSQHMNVWYHIVIGRREQFKEQDGYRFLKQQNEHVEIVPWDRLLEHAERKLD